MAKVKVVVGVYVGKDDYGYTQVISEEKYSEKVKEQANFIYNDEDAFFDWLADNYDVEDVFKWTEEEKKAIKEITFKQVTENWADEELAEVWGYEEIETEVEVSSSCPCNK